MALIDRLSFDSSGMATNHKNALLKGIAKQNNIRDENNDLDISSPAGLLTMWKEQKINELISLAFDAQNEETLKNAEILDITNA